MKILNRTLGFVAVLALSAVFTSCNKVKDLVKINVPLQTADVKFEIQPVGAGEVKETGFQFGINIDSVLKKENSDLGIGNIKKVKVKSITLNLTNATQADNWALSNLLKLHFLLTTAITLYLPARQTILKRMLLL